MFTGPYSSFATNTIYFTVLLFLSYISPFFCPSIMLDGYLPFSINVIYFGPPTLFYIFPSFLDYHKYHYVVPDGYFTQGTSYHCTEDGLYHDKHPCIPIIFYANEMLCIFQQSLDQWTRDLQPKCLRRTSWFRALYIPCWLYWGQFETGYRPQKAKIGFGQKQGSETWYRIGICPWQTAYRIYNVGTISKILG